MLKKKQWMAILALTVTPISAFAATEVSINPSYTIPVGSTKDLYKSAPSIHFDVFFPSAESNVAFGAEFGLVFSQKIKDVLRGDFDADLIQDEIPLTSFPKDDTETSFHILPVARWSPFASEQDIALKPYLLGGVGIFRTSGVSSDAAGSGTLSGGLQVDATVASYDRPARTDFGFVLGGGIAIDLSSQVSLGAAVRYQHILRRDTESGASVPDGKFIEPSITLGFKF